MAELRAVMAVDEGRSSPLWAALGAVKDQPERLVALNALWSAQLAPAALALGFPGWPLTARASLLAYSLLALPPFTLALYRLAGQVLEGEELNLRDVRSAVRALWRPSYAALLPLCTLPLGALWLATRLTAALPGALAQLAALLLGALWLYWGPLLARTPQLGPLALLAASARLALRAPLLTLGVGVCALGGSLLGLVTVGGLVLIAPVTVALLQVALLERVKTSGGGA